MMIDHTALYCTDLEGVRAFFQHYFGAASGDQYHNPRTGLRTYILTFPDGGSRLELMTRPEVVPQEANLFRQGFIHLSFSLGSREAVDKLTERLKADGYEVISGPRITGDGYYETAFWGPEHLLLEITA